MVQKFPLKKQVYGSLRTKLRPLECNRRIESWRKRSMKRHVLFCAVGLLILMPRANAQKPFTLEQLMSAPFPSNLTAAKNANRVAWVLDQEGRRNIWAAEGPGFAARQITKYSEDDGQELSDLSFSSDSSTIVYVRGDG